MLHSLFFFPSDNSAQTSRLSNYSGRHFDFLDTHHSVFSRNRYYDDMLSIHPWSRRPCSRSSGIPFVTLRSSSCSGRLNELARPKIKREQLVRQGNLNYTRKRQQKITFFHFISPELLDNRLNYGYSGVKATALTSQCSDRLVTLSQPKKISRDYLDAYILPKSVSELSLHAEVSRRVCELSKPRRNIIFIQSAWKNKHK